MTTKKVKDEPIKIGDIVEIKGKKFKIVYLKSNSQKGKIKLELVEK